MRLSKKLSINKFVVGTPTPQVNLRNVQLKNKKQIQKILHMMAMSLDIGIGWTFLTFLTAFAASPAVVFVCVTLGECCYRGGVQSFLRTMTRESIVEGCDIKNHVKSFGLGCVAWIPGVIAAVQAASITSTQQISFAVASASPGTTAISLATDAEKKICWRRRLNKG